MATDRGHLHRPAELQTGRLNPSSIDASKTKKVRNNARHFNLNTCLTIYLVLVSLFAATIAASVVPHLRNSHLTSGLSPVTRHHYRAFLPPTPQAERSAPASSQLALIESSNEENDAASSYSDDSDVDRFLEQLVAARRQLDERLARDEADQRAALGQLAAGESASSRDGRVRYELDENSNNNLNDDNNRAEEFLGKANRLAAEVQFARLANLRQSQSPGSDNSFGQIPIEPVKVITNPVYYSVSQGDNDNNDISNDPEFSGHFGEPVDSVLRQPQPSKRELTSRRQVANGEKERKLTTLLEEDEESDDSANKRTGETTKKIISSTTEAPKTTTSVSYGRVEERPSEDIDHHASYISSLFGRLYKQLASVMPTAFGGKTQENNSSSSSDEMSRQRKLHESKQANKTGEKTTSLKDREDADQPDEAKREFSVVKEQNDPTGGKVIHVKLERNRQKDDDSSGPSKRVVHLEASSNSDSAWPSAASAEQVVDVRPNLVRQSNLFVPSLGPNDEPVVSKYVYAPTQHYYLGSGASSVSPNSLAQAWRAHGGQLFNNNQQGGQTEEHPFAFQKPDTAFGPLMAPNPLLAGQARPNEASNNDLYFLVMVGAFCIMAIAVVMAAGLFAYRVQQNRKLSQSEQEYPTYGVVGPNNAMGGGGAKCGAAAFVGGYLAHHANNHGSSSFAGLSSGVKSASAKHLPDLYATGSDSGLASLDRLSSSKKSSSASEQHQQQQQVVGQQQQPRPGPTNFMTCALSNNQDAARMYHYQHQKQQMIVSDRSSAGRHTSASDLDSEDENDDGSYTVYECPGLASAHEMEIKNPLFNDERSP